MTTRHRVTSLYKLWNHVADLAYTNLHYEDAWVIANVISDLADELQNSLERVHTPATLMRRRLRRLSDNSKYYADFAKVAERIQIASEAGHICPLIGQGAQARILQIAQLVEIDHLLPAEAIDIARQTEMLAYSVEALAEEL